eukprot:TRINITY_DN1084_c10_g1_i1.p1 TRINITY_DN1084_c10_g1~~TRINITY_DN1084_c10_g1_i1.p1  ORF type:complete len:569 (-),score=163.78 TRINITY_DN1084_c10_g1_i1:23-1729(-)
MSRNPNFEVSQLFAEQTKLWIQKPQWDQITKIIELIHNNPKTSTTLSELIYRNLDDKEPKVVWLSLLILDAVMKCNPPEAFVQTVSLDAFMKKLSKLVLKRYVKTKKGHSDTATYKNWVGFLTAHMISDWGAIQYANTLARLKFPIFYRTYTHLLEKGVHFPAQDALGAMPRFKAVDTTPKRKTSVKKATDDTKASTTKISPEITSLINCTKNAATLLNDIVNNHKGGKLQKDEVCQQVEKQLMDEVEKIRKLVPEYLDNETICAALLGVLDSVEKILDRYNRACEGKQEKKLTYSSDDDDDESKSDEPKNYVVQSSHVIPNFNVSLTSTPSSTPSTPSTPIATAYHHYPNSQFNHHPPPNITATATATTQNPFNHFSSSPNNQSLLHNYPSIQSPQQLQFNNHNNNTNPLQQQQQQTHPNTFDMFNPQSPHQQQQHQLQQLSPQSTTTNGSTFNFAPSSPINNPFLNPTGVQSTVNPFANPWGSSNNNGNFGTTTTTPQKPVQTNPFSNSNLTFHTSPQVLPGYSSNINIHANTTVQSSPSTNPSTNPSSSSIFNLSTSSSTTNPFI